MINAEKFRKELLELSNQNIAFAVRKENQNAVVRCDSIKRCTDCLFGRGRCSVNSTKWLLSEYKEPVKLTRLEYEILTYILKNTECRYITRNKSRSLCVHSYKPVKDTKYGHWTAVCDKVKSCEVFNNLFPFIKWEDTDPALIKDVLDNCEVVDDD